jgi:hypothetical protein
LRRPPWSRMGRLAAGRIARTLYTKFIPLPDTSIPMRAPLTCTRETESFDVYGIRNRETWLLGGGMLELCLIPGSTPFTAWCARDCRLRITWARIGVREEDRDSIGILSIAERPERLFRPLRQLRRRDRVRRSTHL